MQDSVDEDISNYTGVGAHRVNNYEDEVAKMVNDLHGEDLFTRCAGRYHPSFQTFKEMKNEWKPREVAKWLNDKKKLLHRENKRSKADATMIHNQFSVQTIH